MSYIDFDYISASSLTRRLASHLTQRELSDLVLDLINDAIVPDLSRAQGYVIKYDNPIDLAEGTDVRPLISEIGYLETNLKLIADLIRKGR